MVKVKLCMGSSCFARGNGDILAFLEEYISSNNLDVQVSLSGCHCQNCCSEGPNVFINDEKYMNVSKEKIVELLTSACMQE